MEAASGTQLMGPPALQEVVKPCLGHPFPQNLQRYQHNVPSQ